MNDLKSKILEVLATILTPNGQNMVSADIVRALSISHGDVSFVIEVGGSEVSAFSEIIKKAKKEITEIDGVTEVSIILTSHESRRSWKERIP